MEALLSKFTRSRVTDQTHGHGGGWHVHRQAVPSPTSSRWPSPLWPFHTSLAAMKPVTREGAVGNACAGGTGATVPLGERMGAWAEPHRQGGRQTWGPGSNIRPHVSEPQASCRGQNSNGCVHGKQVRCPHRRNVGNDMKLVLFGHEDIIKESQYRCLLVTEKSHPILKGHWLWVGPGVRGVWG